ncbi:ABC transporter C-terminal domain-containing protein, partial [Kerstersia gyiorum]
AAKPQGVKALSSWEQRELDALPGQISELENEQESLTEQLADGSLYRDQPSEVVRIQARLEEIETTILEKMERWEQLELRSQG